MTIGVIVRPQLFSVVDQPVEGLRAAIIDNVVAPSNPRQMSP
jgi:hypothetical protein